MFTVKGCLFLCKTVINLFMFCMLLVLNEFRIMYSGMLYNYASLNVAHPSFSLLLFYLKSPFIVYNEPLYFKVDFCHIYLR